MMSKTAMKLALEALELEDMACRYEKEPTPDHIDKAITALREALAEQPAQQEPTKAMIDAAERIDWSDSDVRGNIVNMWQAMCAVAPQLAQQQEYWEEQPDGSVIPVDPSEMQPAQLPFGVGGGLVAIKTLLSRDPCAHASTAIQMIDAILAEQPAQRTWVGLTDKEILAIDGMSDKTWVLMFARAIEARLKEKNT